jgi:hypothetical protein
VLNYQVPDKRNSTVYIHILYVSYWWSQLLNEYYSHFINILKVFTEKV